MNRDRSASAKMLHLREEIGELEIELRVADKKKALEDGELPELTKRKQCWKVVLFCTLLVSAYCYTSKQKKRF